MFIRQTKTANKITGEGYFTYRLVRGERIGGKVRQITVLNLGRNFAIGREDWPLLCSRIEQIMRPQEALLPIQCADHIERAAQRYVGQLIARTPEQDDATGSTAPAPETVSSAVSRATDIQEVDVNSLQLTLPRSVGVEHLALHALSQLGFVEKLTELGVSGVVAASAAYESGVPLAGAMASCAPQSLAASLAAWRNPHRNWLPGNGCKRRARWEN